ncbi:MAG: serine/threonine-protein kinase [Oscillochloridaceae bacterium]|nr:serine/threonine protein kinase [Chloroflexaceae bacterium]MDW8388772.1 serine/threonine-protein kinase [Oscillochloridaceae bacterium]
MPEAAATPSSAPLLFGRYRVSEHRGDTRLASVYAAMDERLQRRVLIHILRKDLVGQTQPHVRFIAQIGQMARRSHPALLDVYDSGEASGRPFMVTEFVSGRPLRGLGLLTPERALHYLRQVTSAIALCQSRRDADAPLGLYHPPISSSNLLLVDEGRVKLVDSWLLPPDEAQADIAHYRAPELSQGQEATLATPVYALGLLCYELLTGIRPITGDDARAIALAHLNARVPALHVARPGLYLPAIERLVARATARAPEQRFPDAATFGGALDALWRDLGAPTQPLAPAARRAGAVIAPSPPAAAPPLPAPARPQPVDPATVRRNNILRGLLGWAVLAGLVLLVAAASFFAVNALSDALKGVTMPGVPWLPPPPTGSASGPPSWLDTLFGADEIYIVNIAEGLNLRREPDATDPANVIAVIPNGTLVRKLDGPRVSGNIPWLRVRVTVEGQELEGWMSLNYLRRKE